MKRLSLLTLLAVLCFILPVVAQDEMKEEAGMGAEMMPPPALDDEFLSWLVGEWEGTSEGTMGMSKDNYKMSIGLNSQFLLMEVNSDMNGTPFTGMGAVTLAQDGSLAGYWIDSYRLMAAGKGSREGDVETIVWTDQMGGVYTRVTKKIDENTFEVTGKYVMGDQVMEDKGVMTRKMMTDK